MKLLIAPGVLQQVYDGYGLLVIADVKRLLFFLVVGFATNVDQSGYGVANNFNV